MSVVVYSIYVVLYAAVQRFVTSLGRGREKKV